MATVNEKLQSDAIRHAVFLQRLSNQEVKEILSLLNDEVYPDVEAEISRRLRKNLSTKRFNEMKQAYSTILREGYANASDKLKADLKPIAVNEAQFQTTLLRNAVSPINLSFTVPSTRTLQALVNQDIRGQTINKWFSNLSDTTADEITRRLKIGIAQGDSIQRLNQRIRGTRARDFNDGAIQASRRHAETITRTSVTDITTKAREETYKENDDIIKGVQWLSTLDAKTSDICQSLDGEVFKVDEGQRPPAHMQCRSTTVPITKSWKELGIDLAEAPPGTRSSLNGQVPAKTNYPEWLKTQSKDVQIQALGKGRAEIFRRGKLPNKEIFKIREKPLTLKEMKKLESDIIKGKPLVEPKPRVKPKPKPTTPTPKPVTSIVTGEKTFALKPETIQKDLQTPKPKPGQNLTSKTLRRKPVDTNSQVKENADKLFKDFDSKLSKENLGTSLHGSLRSYIRGGVTDMQAVLRGGPEAFRIPVKKATRIKARIKNIDTIIDNNKLPTMRSWRGTSRLINDPSAARQMVGTTFNEPGYSSTSINPVVARNFSKDGAIIEFNIRKGQKGIFAESFWQSKKAMRSRQLTDPVGEMEILLPRNLKYKITGFRQETIRGASKIIYEADIL